MNEQSKIIEIASKHLGQKGGEGYKDQYDPSLLVAIPRSLNRSTHQIDYSKDSKYVYGLDVWNAYEVSALTERGLPVTGMLKIICSAYSEYHVESKSLKLYLNSFNMTKFGKNIEECISILTEKVKNDLSELLQDSVEVKFFYSQDGSYEDGFQKLGYTRIQSQIPDLEEVDFTTFTSDPSQLQFSNQNGIMKVSIDFLRSNCRVTSQPDWGTLYLYMRAYDLPDLKSVAKYVVSHRTISHFHEEVVEMMYKHLHDKFNPVELLVCALYTRRGGIDINPIRTSHLDLIPEFMIDPTIRLTKTLMQ